MVDWSEHAKHKDLRAVIDPADNRGLKNKYINTLHHKVLSDAIGDTLKGKRVLDLGCGIGRFTEFLNGCGAVVTGIDSCKEMLELNTGCKTVCAPVYKLPFENNSFDAVLSVWTLQYLDNPTLVETASELNRIVVPGGDVYFIEQISDCGYDGVFKRDVLDYESAFKNFSIVKLQSIMRERDLLVGIIKKGFMPERYFSLLTSFHLNINKNLHLNRTEYIDYFMIFRKMS